MLRRFDHRAGDQAARRTQQCLGHPTGCEAPSADDRSARDNERRERDHVNGARASFDFLEFAFAIELDACAIEQRLIGARSECVANRNEQAREDQTGNAIGKPTADHSRNLDERAEDQASTIAKLVSEPARRDFESHEQQVASSHRRRNQRRRHLLLLYPPQEIEAIHDAFDGGDLVGKVECEVSAVRGSIRRHGDRVSKSDPVYLLIRDWRLSIRW